MDSNQIGLLGFMDKDEGSSTDYSVIAIRNLSWPGAFMVCNNQSWFNFYLGYAQKLSQQQFYLLGLEQIQEQPVQLDQFPQPNPFQPPDQVQPDSDDQNKQQQVG